jgi:SPP1 family phage portal protein
MKINKIKIPIKPENVSQTMVELYLPDIYTEFLANSGEIARKWNIFCLQHEIMGKTRVHEDTDINNIVVEPHIFALVDWKVGYVLGNPIKFAQSKATQLDDIQFLNKYIRSSKKRSVDKEVALWTYTTGVGYSFIQTKSGNYNIDNECPFELYCRNADSCTKVYSAYNGNAELFDMLYTNILVKDEITKQNKKIDILSIYTPDYFYEYETENGKTFTLVQAVARPIYKKLPLVEKRFNPMGIGIVDIAETLQNAIDKISSNSLDNVEEVVNEIYVYKNVNLGETPQEIQSNHRAMKRNGAVVINSGNKELQADLTTLSTKLEHSDVAIVKEDLKRTLYDVVGVPMPSSNTNSGGTTKQGSEVANGYENAYNRALSDINTFLEADTDLLDRILFICKSMPNNHIDMLSLSEIEIKYSLNISDNMLTKSQSYVNFVENGMPPSLALEKCKISNDSEAEGLLIAEHLKSDTWLAISKQKDNNVNNIVSDNDKI